jgi:hypothetical protein
MSIENTISRAGILLSKNQNVSETMSSAGATTKVLVHVVRAEEASKYGAEVKGEEGEGNDVGRGEGLMGEAVELALASGKKGPGVALGRRGSVIQWSLESTTVKLIDTITAELRGGR